MGKVLFTTLFTGIMFVLPALVAAEETTLTNKDLEKYRVPEAKTAQKPAGHKDAKSGDADRAKEHKEQEQWCKKATALQRKIEKAKDAVAALEQKLSAATKDETPLEGPKRISGTKTKKVSAKTGKALGQKLEKSRKELSYAERDLSDLQEEAHRKNIPPGWLRCQFTW